MSAITLNGHISVMFDEENNNSDRIYINFSSHTARMRADTNGISESAVGQIEHPISLHLVRTWISSIKGVVFTVRHRQRSVKFRASVQREGETVTFDIGIMDQNRSRNLQNIQEQRDINFLSAWLKTNIEDGFVVHRS